MDLSTRPPTARSPAKQPAAVAPDNERSSTDDNKNRSSSGFGTRVLLAVAIVALVASIWIVRDVLLLGFAGVLLALALRAGADLLERRLHWSPRWALTAVLLAASALLALAGWLIGEQVVKQANELVRTLPRNVDQIRDWIEETTLGSMLIESIETIYEEQSASRAAGIAFSTIGALGSVILVVVISIYVAASPDQYRSTALQFAPRHLRPRIERGLDASAIALRKFLFGQAIAMVAVGTLTGLGLWLLDMPLALVLGIIAGLLDFVPFYGPILAAVPAILLALTIGPEAAAYVALLYLAIQQIEGNLVSPLIQERTVCLPPAVGLFAVAAFGLLLGPLGVVLGAPLTVMAIALVREWSDDPDLKNRQCG